MKCPFCDYPDTKVLESRESGDSIRRRRECLKCGKRFTTYERIETSNIIVVKNSGKKEPYNRDKLLSGLVRSFNKRPVTIAEMNKIIDSIERKLRKLPSQEVSSKKLGSLVLSRLKRIDKVAYVRFASVFYEFSSIDEFKSILEKVDAAPKSKSR